MCLHEQGEAVVGETFDHPQLPERLSAVELLRHDASGESLQLRVVARTRQRRVADVVGQVEVIVVDPDRLVEDRDPAETLPVARHEVQAARDVSADTVDVYAAVGGSERRRLEEDEAAEVHVAVRILEVEEGAILGGDALVESHRAGGSRPLASRL